VAAADFAASDERREEVNVKTLLEFFTAHFDFLYLDGRYRISDSGTSGKTTVDAGLTLTGPGLSWSIHNNRGKLGIGVAPTALADWPENWFRISVVSQYLDNSEEPIVDPTIMVAWTRNNLNRIEALFSGANTAKSCDELRALEEAIANKRFGPA
jgi:hypothetical protein